MHRKSKAFTLLRQHATIPNQVARQHDQTRTVTRFFEKWFRNAYMSRSRKRRREVNEDRAVVVYHGNVQYRFLKAWRLRFVHSFLMKDGLERVDRLLVHNVKYRMWSLWRERFRNAQISMILRKYHLTRSHFAIWRERQRIKKLEHKAIQHHDSLNSDLVLVYFHVWREK
ncbi:hypothetical protein HDU98_011467, partial [Podochytrium sp. JEL0797]